MVQEEQGVILKVNKQKRRVAEVLLSTFITAEGEVGPTRERVMWGFLTRAALMVFHRQRSRPTCLERESASRHNTSHYLFVRLSGDSRNAALTQLEAT